MCCCSFCSFSFNHLNFYRIVLDYSDLPEKYKDLFDSDEVRREGDRLQRHVNDLSNTIQRIQAPNMRVSLLCLFRNYYNMYFIFISGNAKIGFGKGEVTRNQ